jgi:hypothetical protein
MAYWADMDGNEHRECPRKPLMKDTSWFSTLMFYYSQWDKGFLPEPGGINAQPAKFGETMQTIKVILNEVHEANRPKK